MRLRLLPSDSSRRHMPAHSSRFAGKKFASREVSIGLLLMCVAMVVRGILDQHGPLAGVVLWLFAGGGLVMVFGPIYDMTRNRKVR